MSTPQEKALAKFLNHKEGRNWAPRMNGKAKSREYLHAKLTHKPRPVYKPPEKKPTEYKKLSIEEYEKKYPK